MTGLRERVREARLRRGFRRYERRNAVTLLVAAFAGAYPRARFVQIGANDGAQHDHLREQIKEGEWTGVMVEPVPYVFERLRRNYGDVERIALERAAIGARDGRATIHHLAELEDAERDAMPSWYDALGSFDLETLRRNVRAIPDGEERIVGTQVECLTFETLCERHGIEELDLIAIDTEGHDAVILAGIDLERHRPRLVLYEHYHLTSGQREATRTRLREAGYETMEEGFDTYCLEPRDDELTQAWRRLRPAMPGLSAVD
jgi:FkbM family methyltransferase